jgi:hypothetical protein
MPCIFYGEGRLITGRFGTWSSVLTVIVPLQCFSLVTGARDSILETRIKISVRALWVQCLERYRCVDRLISVDSRKEMIGVDVVRILLKEIPSEVDPSYAIRVSVLRRLEKT